MLTPLRHRSLPTTLLTAAVALAVLALAFYLGQRATVQWLGRLAVGLGALVLLAKPSLGILVLVPAALVVKLQFNTGTEVRLNPVTLLIPAVAVLWLLDMIRRRQVQFVASPVNRPLILFLAASLISLLIGRATWNPLILVGEDFLLVQLGQWAIFAFSALAFWLAANLIADEKTLWRLTALFLLIAGSVAILRALPGMSGLVWRYTTGAFSRAPLWMLLTALASGQLLWNRQLSPVWRLFLLATLLAAMVYAFVDQRDATSNWMGLATVLAVLIWLRFPRLRWLFVIIVAVLAVVGLFPSLYNFAGGDEEWTTSGGSRLVLIERVVDVTMRNPITGLGPAAYRPYANATPLAYLRAYYVAPNVSSHNNYVDLFAHGGIVGLALFGWFVVELVRTGLRLRQRYQIGFAAAYVNGTLAAGAGALVIMMFADWILPFVYNIGFPGFQASVLVWLFLGGLVALENMPTTVAGDQ